MIYLNIFYKFFTDPSWDAVGNFFTLIGIISPIIAIFRFVHNSRIKNWQDNVSIQDYPSDYDVELNEKNAIYSKIWTETPDTCISTIIFKPKNTIISKLEIISLDMDGKATGIVDTFKKISPDDSICFRIKRAENIPLYKLKWYADFGEYSEYCFDENRRNGDNEVKGTCYKATFFSIVRRIIGFR